jgi:hypothetical protein
MSEIIIYTQENGQVATCHPTGEIHINDVLAKDIPDNATNVKIIDDAILPNGSDAEFFDAWVWDGNQVTINFTKAQSDYLARYNALAIKVAQKRQLNALAGLPNTPDDATWQAQLTSDREAIAAATTTTQLLEIALQG